MNENRWTGVGAIVVGGVICGWQLYEVHSGDSFTFWFIWFVPLPVVVLGILFLLAGLWMLFRG